MQQNPYAAPWAKNSWPLPGETSQKCEVYGFPLQSVADTWTDLRALRRPPKPSSRVHHEKPVYNVGQG
jgi:hypothetical protein